MPLRPIVPMPSDQEINEFLAKACGLEDMFAAPNYLNNLNAMADVRRVIRERGLTAGFIERMWASVYLVAARHVVDFNLLDAPARVQALAAYEVLKGASDA